MELKLQNKVENGTIRMAANRTTMELKPGRISQEEYEKITANRTTMELKPENQPCQ